MCIREPELELIFGKLALLARPGMRLCFCVSSVHCVMNRECCSHSLLLDHVHTPETTHKGAGRDQYPIRLGNDTTRAKQSWFLCCSFFQLGPVLRRPQDIMTALASSNLKIFFTELLFLRLSIIAVASMAEKRTRSLPATPNTSRE